MIFTSAFSSRSPICKHAGAIKVVKNMLRRSRINAISFFFVISEYSGCRFTSYFEETKFDFNIDSLRRYHFSKCIYHLWRVYPFVKFFSDDLIFWIRKPDLTRIIWSSVCSSSSSRRLTYYECNVLASEAFEIPFFFSLKYLLFPIEHNTGSHSEAHNAPLLFKKRGKQSNRIMFQ